MPSDQEQNNEVSHEVAIRIRPINEAEITANASCILSVDSDDKTVSIKNPENGEQKTLAGFNHCWNSCSTDEQLQKSLGGPFVDQEQVYKNIGVPLLKSTLEDSCDLCVFLHGAAGAGKTYTLTGGQGNQEKDQGEEGLLQRVLKRACLESDKLAKRQMWSISGHVSLSIVQVYGDKVNDLLRDRNQRASHGDLKVKTDTPKSSVFDDAIKLDCTTQGLKDIENLIKTARASAAEIVAEGKNNATDNDSHILYFIKFEKQGFALSVDGFDGHYDEEAAKEVIVEDGIDDWTRSHVSSTITFVELVASSSPLHITSGPLGSVVGSILKGDAITRPRRIHSVSRKIVTIGCVSPASTNYADTVSTLGFAEHYAVKKPVEK